MKSALGAIVLIAVAVTLVWTGAAFRLGQMTDANGVPLSHYAGVYGFPGGNYVQAVAIDGWVIVALGGLALARWPSRRLPDPSLDDARAWLAPADNALHVSYGTSAFPRRPRERPTLASMCSLDGKSGTLLPCAPGTLQRLELLRLALGRT